MTQFSQVINKPSGAGNLLNAITSSQTTIQLLSGQGANFPQITGLGYFRLTCEYEVMICTAISGDTLTVERGQETSLGAAAAYAHTANTPVSCQITAGMFEELQVSATNTSSATGWTSPQTTWTYNSSSAINVPSGAASIYSVGDKISFQQSIPLTSYWTFNSNSNDSVGSNNGTDTAMTYTAGRFGNAATFNGSTSNIAITNNSSLEPTGAFTVGMWFKTSASGTYQTLFQSQSQNTNVAGFQLQITTTGFLVATCGKNTGNTGATDYSFIAGHTIINDGNWHYVVMEIQNNFAKMFLDGNLETSSYTYMPVYASTNYVRVGCGNISGPNITFFNGQIDDLFFINGYGVDSAWVAAQYALNAAQGTANIAPTQYFYTITVADTLLTLTGGSDYSVYNGAITSNYYSKQDTPLGFPQWFNYGATLSNIIGSGNGKFSLVSRNVLYTIDAAVGGSASGNITISLPLSPVAPYTNAYYPLGSAVDVDSGTGIATGIAVNTGSNALALFNYAATPGALAEWDATYPHTWKSGDSLYISGSYEI